MDCTKARTQRYLDGKKFPRSIPTPQLQRQQALPWVVTCSKDHTNAHAQRAVQGAAQIHNAVVITSSVYTPAYSLRIAHLLVLELAIFSLGKEILLFAAALDLVGDELLVLLERALDVQFEPHDIVEHALDLGVKFFSERVGAELELFVSGGALATGV